VFCDIRSFTTIVEAREPAETIELLNDYYTLMMDAIGGEGGIVNQMVGDGLMAIFGAPLPREDHRQRAVLAARQMVDLIRLFNEERAARDKLQIQIGVGIASGRWWRATRARTTERPTPAWATPSTSPLVSSRTRRS
jgi:class 3 adenylate cyclase